MVIIEPSHNDIMKYLNCKECIKLLPNCNKCYENAKKKLTFRVATEEELEREEIEKKEKNKNGKYSHRD